MSGNNLDLSVRLKFIDDELRPAIERLKTTIQSVRGSLKDADVGFSKTIADTKQVNSELSKTESLLTKFVGFAVFGKLLKDSLRLADAYKEINARLRIAASGNDDYVASQKNVLDISLKTGTSLQENANLYQKLRINANLASNDATRLTKVIAQASQLDGGGESARLGIIQLQQALASGKLAGDELRSLREQNTTLVEEIRKGMGLSRQQFSLMAKDGGFAADEVIKAMLKMEGDIGSKFAELPITTARAFENLKTNATVKIGEIDAAIGASTGFANFVNAIGNNFTAFIALTVGALALTTKAWLASIATKRAAEKAAHIARLKEIAQQQIAELALLKKPSVSTTVGATGVRKVTSAIDTKAIAEGELALAAVNRQILTAGKGAFSLSNVLSKLGSLFRLIVNPITVAVGLFALFVKYITDLINVDSELSSSLGGTVTVWETLNAIVEIVTDTIKNLIGFVGYLGSQLLDSLSGVTDYFSNTFGDLSTIVKNFLNGILNFLPALGKTIALVAAYIVIRFQKAFGDLKNIVSAFGTDLKAALNGDFTFNGLSKAIKKAGQNLDADKAFFKEEFGKIVSEAANGDTVDAIVKGIGAQIERARKAAKAKQIKDKPTEEATGTTPGKEDKTGNKLPTSVKVATDETTLLQAQLDSRKAALERQYAEDILLAGDNVNKKLSLAQEYFKNLNGLAVEQTNIDKRELEQQVKAKQEQLDKLDKFEPKNKGQAVSKQAAMETLTTEIGNLNAKLEAENIKLATTIADNNSKAKQVSLDLVEKQKEALKQIQDEVKELNNEADALSLSEEAYKEYLLQKQLANELAKLELAGIEKTTAAYIEQAKALEEALRNKQKGEEAKKQREEQKRIEDDMYKNVQQGVQKVFASGLKTLGKSGTLREVAYNVAGTIKDAMAEALAGTFANMFLDLFGGKNGIIKIAGSLGLGGGGKKGDSVTNPIYTRDADAIATDALSPTDILKEESTGLFESIGSLFSNIGDKIMGLFTNVGSFISSIFSGGGAGGGGGFGGIISAIGGLFGFETGGYTGDGAANQPKGIVHGGEYVFTKKATSKAGIGFLSSLQQALTGGFVPNVAKIGYADGGYVDIPKQAAPAQQQQSPATRIINVIDPAMAGEYLQSSAGEKVLMNFIGRNKSGIRTALG